MTMEDARNLEQPAGLPDLEPRTDPLAAPNQGFPVRVIPSLPSIKESLPFGLPCATDPHGKQGKATPRRYDYPVECHLGGD